MVIIMNDILTKFPGISCAYLDEKGNIGCTIRNSVDFEGKDAGKALLLSENIFKEQFVATMEAIEFTDGKSCRLFYSVLEKIIQNNHLYT